MYLHSVLILYSSGKSFQFRLAFPPKQGNKGSCNVITSNRRITSKGKDNSRKQNQARNENNDWGLKICQTQSFSFCIGIRFVIIIIMY